MPNLNSICDWYQTDAGRLLADKIEPHIWQMTACVFGYTAVQLGNVFLEKDLLKNCTIAQKVILDQARNPTMYADSAALPLSHDSVDLFVLPHTLDFVAEPHQVLREVERCLVPDGHMLIIGFNPISFYGLWKIFLRRNKVAPWNAHFYSIHRIHDWCSLLGFDVVETRYTAHLPPFKKIQAWGKMQAVEQVMQKRLAQVGGVYMCLARKRIATITPIKSVWPSTDQLLTGKLVKPAVRMRDNGRTD